MVSVRAVVLLFVFASTFLSVAEAKKKGTPLTNKLFSSSEHHFLHNPKVVKAWKAVIKAKKAAATKKAAASRASKSKVHTAAAFTVTPTCPFIDNGVLGLGSPPAGLTVCQLGACNCPNNEVCIAYQSPSLDGMGMCACGSNICTPDVGLTCVPMTMSSGTMSMTCATSATMPTPTPSPYGSSKLMRKML